MNSLYDELKSYSDKNIYSCHMPGHKGHALGAMTPDYAEIDFTEVTGLDDLHDPEGIILEAQKNAASVLGADETFFLINGSTAGILTAISASVKRGGKLVMSRGCHKSAYNALLLRDIRPGYIFPKGPDQDGIYDAPDVFDVRCSLEENPDAEAVLIVSPTYEGRMSDIAAIAEEVHKHGIPLIVDEAHGAHLSFTEGSKADALRCGADIVIQSVHKTLPAPTQTALLSVRGELADRTRIREYLSVYQSSSPSYPLMAMIDGCIRYVSENRENLIQNLHDNFENLLKRLEVCDTLLFGPNLEDLRSEKADYGKLVVSCLNAGISGAELARLLLEEHGIEAEMSGPGYVLLMFTVGDMPEGYDRVVSSLIALDEKLTRVSGEVQADTATAAPETPDAAASARPATAIDIPRPIIRMPYASACEAERDEIPLSESTGRIASNIICLYPPGTPIIAPGEEIREEHISFIEKCLGQGFNIKGLVKTGTGAPVVKAVKSDS